MSCVRQTAELFYLCRQAFFFLCSVAGSAEVMVYYVCEVLESWLSENKERKGGDFTIGRVWDERVTFCLAGWLAVSSTFYASSTWSLYCIVLLL